MLHCLIFSKCSEIAFSPVKRVSDNLAHFTKELVNFVLTAYFIMITTSLTLEILDRTMLTTYVILQTLKWITYLTLKSFVIF